MTRRRQKLRQQEFFRNNPDLFAIADSDTDLDSTLAPLADEAVERSEQLRFISFGSGSSGNCAYIGTPSVGILLDAGVDNNRVETELASNAIKPSAIAGILLTHDHSDHVRYAYALLRRHKNWKIYATPKAMNGLLRRHSISRRISDYHQPIYKEIPFKIGPLTITAFETSHDGSDNVGFSIRGCSTHFVLATDTGIITERADYYIRQAEHLMIEADYDADMLRHGPYPERLKARIASDSGHMCNADTAAYLASVVAGGNLHSVALCHLSHINNTPALALGTVRQALEDVGAAVTDMHSLPDDPRLRLSVLPRLESSLMVILHSFQSLAASEAL